MNKKEFDIFFKPYSKNVDNANRHGFWKLSDALVTQIIKDNIPVKINKDSVILDAGGGTGRWVCDLSKIYKSIFIVYDLSRDMLEKAEDNIRKHQRINKIKEFIPMITIALCLAFLVFAVIWHYKYADILMDKQIKGFNEAAELYVNAMQSNVGRPQVPQQEGEKPPI